MTEIEEKPMIGTVTQLQCRSYSAREFDGCSACADAALGATEQAVLYILGRAALGQPEVAEGSFEMAHVLRIRLIDDDGSVIASDEVRAEQSISAVPVDETAEPVLEESEETPGMRLEDFQTVLDRLELGAMGSGMCGTVAGRLYGFERSIGRFEVEVSPAR